MSDTETAKRVHRS